MLTCSVCLELVKEPLTLMQCFHNYCKVCAEKLIQTQKNEPPGVMCPLCSKFSAESEVRKNYFVNDLLQLHSSLGDQTSTHKLCEHCPDDKPVSEAAWKCLDCHSNLCNSCKAYHARFPVMKGHKVIKLTDDTKELIDRLVLCTKHPDEPIKFFCNQCGQEICITCQVINHKNHDILTVQDALERIIPDIKKDLEVMAKKEQNMYKAIKHMEEETANCAGTFDECIKSIDSKADQRIEEINKARKRMKDEVNDKKVEQIEKLQTSQSQLVNQQKEISGLKTAAVTSIENAAGASLLTQLVEGGLWERVHKTSWEMALPGEILVTIPELNALEYGKFAGMGLLGKVVFRNIVLGNGSVGKCENNISVRYWKGDFKQLFPTSQTEKLKIGLPGYCVKVTVSHGKVWVPILREKIIHVYSENGLLLKSIDVDGSPRCVEKSACGEMLVCCSDTGLFVLSEESRRLVNIDRGQYSDMCVYADKVYGLEHRNEQIVEFVRGHAGWERQRVVKFIVLGHRHDADTLLVRQSKGGSTEIEFFVCLCLQHTILRVTEEGQQITRYGMYGVQGQQILQHPRLCGLDSQGQLLIADETHSQYKVLNTETGAFSTVFTGDGPVLDIKVKDEHTVWFSRKSGGNWVITKC